MEQNKKKNSTAAAPAASSERKLKVLAVGIGGRGSTVIREVAKTEEIIGLCDIDWKYADRVFKEYPNAKRYKDWRVMYKELLPEADAVIVATADHTHAIIAANAIIAGKHVYVEKPMAYSVYESRLLTKLAAKYKVATQQGNQGASGGGVRRMCSWIWAGEIGEVRKVEIYTNRPIWPQGLNRPEEEHVIPPTMDWDNFIGPAPMRPFNHLYTPWNFRGWWDFGTGALGDMGNHLFQVVVKALNLGHPTKIQGSSTLLLNDCAPCAETVHYTFPARDNMAKVAMPELELIWYDGGLMPPRPADLADGKELPSGSGVIFHGSKDTLICSSYGGTPFLASGRKPNTPEVLRKVTLGHYLDWVRACKEDPSVRVPSMADFAESGPLNEIIVLGCAAIRLQALNQELEWDGENMRFTNIPEGAKIKTCIKDGFVINEGHPSFKKTWTDEVDANEFAKELINRTPRPGWELPPMPA